MITSLFAAITSFIISLIALPVVIGYSKRKNLFVIPGGRRIHKKMTPSLGGVAIFAGFIISSFSWIPGTGRIALLILFGVLIITFVIGLADDVIHLRPSLKLLGQAIAGSLIIIILNIRITSWYGLFGDQPFPEIVSFALTLITIIIITNSFNLIDGVDGLAGTFSLVALLFFGIWFSYVKDFHYALLSFALSGGILAFLLLNWEPSKIFMGDTGSLIIGMMLSVFVIEFLNQNHQLPADSIVKFNASVGTAICILIIPITDTVRVIILRLYKKVSPFTPDKRHIHHALMNLGLSHRLVVSVLCSTHLIFISIAIFLRKLDDRYVLTFGIVTATILCVLLGRMISGQTFSKK